jgi:uncharacterized protein (TIGR03086 family)
MTEKTSNEAVKISRLLEVASGQAVPVVRGIRDDQLGARTPCSEYDVHALANHLFQMVLNFQALAAKKSVDLAAEPEHLDGPWRDHFADETVRLVAAWDAPDAEEGVSAGMGLPSRTIGTLALGELTVHVWDLARATGQPYAPDPVVVEVLSLEYGELAAKARATGAFGEPFGVTKDATEFEALLSGTGRDPYWTRA